MKKPERTTVDLVEPDQAMLGYLQTLLDEIPPETQTAEKPAPPAPALPPVTAPPVAPPPPRQKTAVAPPVPQVVAVETPATAAPAAVEPLVPEWAGKSFQLLYFRTGGVELGIPLLGMQHIARLDGTLTRLPGMPSWHMGMLRLRGENINVVDLRRLLLPGHQIARTADTPGYVMVLGEGVWGLACDNLGQALRVESADVRWRRPGATPRYIQGVHEQSLRPILHLGEVIDDLERGISR